jgi:hypothetical protein
MKDIFTIMNYIDQIYCLYLIFNKIYLTISKDVLVLHKIIKTINSYLCVASLVYLT